MTLAQDLARITQNMRKISATEPRFRGCIYGNSGCGKSVLAAKIMKRIVSPNKGVLHIDTSEGWVSINNLPGLSEGIMTVPFTTIEDIRSVIQAVREKQGVFQYVGGIILDEASTMSQIDLDRVFEQRKKQGLTDSPTPEWPDYHAALARFRMMLSELFDVPDLHVILLAHVSEKKGSKNEVAYTYPGFSDKTAKKVKEPLHLVGYMTAGIKPAGPEGEPRYERIIQVHPTFKIDAKNRLPISKLKVSDEELPEIIASWIDSGAQERQNDSTPRKDSEPTEESTTLTIEEADSEIESDDDFDFQPVNISE